MSPEPSFSVETPWIAASKSPVQLRNSWISPLGKFAPQPVLFVLPEEAIGSKVVSCVLACGVSATDWWFLRAFCCVPSADAVGPGKPPQREQPSVCGKTVEDGLKSMPDLRISWITTLARLDHGPYCCSCPKGPKDRQPERGCLHQAAGGRTRGSSGRFVCGPR